MFKTFLTAALLVFTFNLFATGLSDDSAALRSCRLMPSQVDKNQCIDSVKGHRFDNNAVDVCAEGRDYADDYGLAALRCLREIRGQEFDRQTLKLCTGMDDDDRISCLTLVANRKPQDANAFSSRCFRTVDRKAILACMRQIAWQPLRPADSGTVMTGGASAADR